MSLFSRLKDLVRTNVHDLSQSEDPEAVLTNYIDEATEHVRDFGVEFNRIEARCISLKHQIEESEGAITHWHAEAKQALNEGREDIARKALTSEQNEREQTEKLQEDLKVSSAQAAELREQYGQLQQQLTEAKQKLEDLIRRNRTAMAQKSAAESLLNLRPESPLASFDQVEAMVEHHEAEAQASSFVLHGSKSDELEDLKRLTKESKVDEAFSKLKDEVDGNE